MRYRHYMDVEAVQFIDEIGQMCEISELLERYGYDTFNIDYQDSNKPMLKLANMEWHENDWIVIICEDGTIFRFTDQEFKDDKGYEAIHDTRIKHNWGAIRVKVSNDKKQYEYRWLHSVLNTTNDGEYKYITYRENEKGEKISGVEIWKYEEEENEE